MILRLLSFALVLFTCSALSACSGNGSGEESRSDTEQPETRLNEQTVYFVDVRTPEEFEDGHLKNVDFHIDFLSGDFEYKLRDLDKEHTYYLYCRTGNRSGQAKEIMQEKGFENVYNIGGFQDLVDAGLPASSDGNE